MLGTSDSTQSMRGGISPYEKLILRWSFFLHEADLKCNEELKWRIIVKQSTKPASHFQKRTQR
jgi:hypothetical protein